MPYFVMEYLDGHDLGAALEVDGVLGVTTAVDYAMQVCEALAEAYTAGIVHRDIKPANLFLTQGTDGTTLVKLLDFGISKHSSVGDTPELQMTRTSALMGSPRYMAPEQMRSMRRVDHRVDIWSLGVVLHESLTGQPPFVGETLPEVCAAIAADDPVRVRQLRRDVPIELQDIILRCLAKDPEKRYADVARLAQDLAPFASPDASVTARRISRIVKGPSVRPPPAPYEPLASTRPPSMALDDLPPARLAPLSVPPPRRRDGGKRLLPGWALLIVAVVAVPAFVVGALVSSPPLAPEAKPASSTNPSSVTTKPAASTAARPGTAAGSATGAVE
jgi:serine/threonine-protein kinase